LVFSKGKKIPKQKATPKNWTTIVVPNKYPAFIRDTALHERAEGPYQLMDAIGFHEVIITKDHKKQMAQFSVEQIKEVIDVYQERYLELMNEKMVNYISIFHNHGAEAGASVPHPHSQLLAIPLTDPDIQASLSGSLRYFEIQKKCVHCTMNEWDLEDKRRIVFKNKYFVVLCPFASRVSFEVRIYPIEHYAYFERINEEQKWALAEAFGQALGKLYKALKDPAYNFFLHTSPCDGRNYDHYHWHWEILPKTATWAGFELGTGIEISTIEPEKAAQYLQKQ
jgi:UDPglucose--hexose-1-phosphate uridylyltransferase